jgi:hypothetical protein
MEAFAGSQPVKTIAIVGNAPLEPDSRRAAAIDESDLVIRINGFALDVPDGPVTYGRRTDVVVLQWMVRSTPWLFEDYGRRLYLLNEPGRIHWDHEHVPPWWPVDLGLVPVPNREVTIPLAAEMGLEGARWATTGTAAVYLARRAFPEARIRIAGFSFLENTAQKTWAHSYGDPVPVHEHHDLHAEAAFIRRYADAGVAEVLL